jgi:hypothetical protein
MCLTVHLVPVHVSRNHCDDMSSYAPITVRYVTLPLYRKRNAVQCRAPDQTPSLIVSHVPGIPVQPAIEVK